MSQRLAVDNFTFSNGTFIPKHTLFGVAGYEINTDEVKVEQNSYLSIVLTYFQRVYSNPHEFQGFRFVDMDPSKWQMTSLNLAYMTFGIGNRAW